MRKVFCFLSKSKENFVFNLMLWAQKQDVFCFFNERNNKAETSGYGSFKAMAGIGKISELKVGAADELRSLQDYIDLKVDYLIGFLSYDLKNSIEKLESENHDGIGMPLIHFFQPELVFDFSAKSNQIFIEYFSGIHTEESLKKLCEILEYNSLQDIKERENDFTISCRVSEKEYMNNVLKIKEHIQAGDFYELNYCIEFFSENAEINPLSVYEKLGRILHAPFSCFYKCGNNYLISASPERFLRKEGNKISTQPMKGTSRRSADKTEDEKIKQQLFSSEKERSENVMIVDLARNDLSKIAKKKSVKVEELFGIYTFPKVHQMVSTVSAELRDDVSLTEALKAAFPMGSMTGAPKIRAMELIENFETTKRGLFSGTAGYITPEKNFDFNVVIRSIQYNASKKYLSFMVGSAITINSVPEKEYEECLLKAQALLDALK